jgi:pyruvate-formate lyase-activating enzyme
MRARERGLYTVYVTNGFMTPEALDMIGPWLDAWRVDVKGFSRESYSRLAHVNNGVDLEVRSVPATMVYACRGGHQNHPGAQR